MITVMKVKIIKTTQMRGVIASFALLIGLASCSGSSQLLPPLQGGQADLGKIAHVIDGDTVDIDIDAPNAYDSSESIHQKPSIPQSPSNVLGQKQVLT
jgi:hypothetical protein